MKLLESTGLSTATQSVKRSFFDRFGLSLDGRRERREIRNTSRQFVSCVLPLIEKGKVGFPVVAAAADVIAADARLHMWVLSIKTRGGEPRKLDDDGWLRMLDLYDKALKECQAAVLRFSQDDDHTVIADRLQEVAAELNRIPELVLSPSNLDVR
jgi:hypothetical protein